MENNLAITQSLINDFVDKAKEFSLNIKKKHHLNYVGEYFSSLNLYIKNIVESIGDNLDLLAKNPIFGDDFSLAIFTINETFNSFSRFLNLIEKRPKQNIINQFRVDVDLFSMSMKVFSDNLVELIKDFIFDQTSKDIQIRFGLESALFTFACKTNPTDIEPFYTSKFVVLYTYYQEIMEIKNITVPVFESYCGTGKTLCLSWILIIKNLKEKQKTPFFLMTEPSPKHIEPKEEFFIQRIGKYVEITSDTEKLKFLYRNLNDIKKPVFGLLTPFNILPFIYDIKDILNFYDITRIMVDEIHQRTFYLDVFVAIISKLERSNSLHLPLNVCFSSASTIDDSYINSLGPNTKIHKLAPYPLYPVYQSHPKIVGNIKRINSDVIHEETVKVIKDMASDGSKIEDGHILCFCSGIGICTKLCSAVSSSLNFTNETDNSRKIVILHTSLKPNETIEKYFQRLTIEYEKNEVLREGNGYQKGFLYFAPIVLSGIVDDVIFNLAQIEFPGKLKVINKFICATPIFESSFTIDRLSVVVDSGLIKEAGFDLNTCLITMTEKQTSLQSMDQRKGRLGRTMKGNYISIHLPTKLIPKTHIPAVERIDLTSNILAMKNIGIDYETIEHLPTLPNKENLDYAISILEKINAIDQETKKITAFGKELLNYPFLSIYYSAAVLDFREKFEEKPNANFIGAYLATLITMESILLQEKSTEKLSELFNVQSDISTLINALNRLLLIDNVDDDILRDMVEIYGFSYSSFLIFKANIQIIVNLCFPAKSIGEVISLSGAFVRKYGGIIEITDILIQSIIQTFPKWKETHLARLYLVDGVGGFNENPTMIFRGDKCLNFENQYQDHSEIRITKRPGWNGIAIPSEIYCFNITRNINNKTINGSLIHRANKNNQSSILTIETPKNTFNPWFCVLVNSYFDYSMFGLEYFNERKTDQISYFHFSSTSGRVFVSFKLKNKDKFFLIQKNIAKLIELYSFIPRSVLIYRDDIKCIIEVFSNGTEQYETITHDKVYGTFLDKNCIDFCLNNMKSLTGAKPLIRIGAVFIHQSCEKKHLISEKLYLISSVSYFEKLYVYDLINHFAWLQRQIEYHNEDYHENYEHKPAQKLFQFPSNFIHPALFHHYESKKKIVKWFESNQNFPNPTFIEHFILLDMHQIRELQYQMRIDMQGMRNSMDLTYSTISISNKNIESVRGLISSHKNWSIDYRFKVIIAPIVEKNDVVAELLKCENENKTHEEALCCFYICDDPDSPILTRYPITVYNKDGTHITRRMCRDCMAGSLEALTESFYNGFDINYKILTCSIMKPPIIPSVESEDLCWPKIPLGQMIVVLMNNDESLSGLVSAWLNAVGEYAIRIEKKKYTFCPEHPQRLYRFEELKDDGLFIKKNMCTDKSCFNCYCSHCNSWHLSDFKCEAIKNGNFVVNYPKCPRCDVLTFKDGGCNHITCPCGCHWCYKCMAGFKSAGECYCHLSLIHGGCFDL